MRGLGVTKDNAEAARWFQKAAAQGNSVAEVNLGWMYQHGLGVQEDKAQAAGWYEKAAAQGNSLAKSNLEALRASNAKAQ